MFFARWSGFILGCAFSLVFGTGCGTIEYYGQAVRGQMQVLSKREPIEKLIANPATPAELKHKLQLTIQVREFAATELSLPVNGHYRTYADLGRRYVVWNVNAAPEFSLDAKTWWYPIVGRQSYRGYFSEGAAERYASRLEKRGYDTYVDGVEAYSTLGWFRDPLLNTFIHHDDPDLAAILFHELAHQRLYIKGDTDFNEAFATAVEREGVRRWLRLQNLTATLEEYEIGNRREEQFFEVVLRARTRLESLYGKPNEKERTIPADEAVELRKAKDEIIRQLKSDYDRLKQSWSGYAGFDGWFRGPLNNAQLKTVDTYHRLVPAFDQLLREHNGNMALFYEAVERIGKLRDKTRQQQVQALLEKSRKP